VWEQQRGFFAQMKRGFGVGGRAYHLARAVDVTVVVTALEDGYCHVELSADVSLMRSGAVVAAGMAGTALALVGVGTLLIAAPGVGAIGLIGLVPIGAAGAAPILASRVQRTRNGHMQLALEQVIDRLEAGEIKPKHRDSGPAPFIRIADEIRNAIKEGMDQSKRHRRLRP
jgi:hypothetical protein